MSLSRFILAVALFTLIGTPISARAQTPITNPTTVAFTPAADHTLMTSYEFGYFVTAADPEPIRKRVVLVSDMTPSGVDLTFPFPRLDFGSFTHKLRACASAIYCSAWAQADRPTVVLPLDLSNVRLLGGQP